MPKILIPVLLTTTFLIITMTVEGKQQGKPQVNGNVKNNGYLLSKIKRKHQNSRTLSEDKRKRSRRKNSKDGRARKPKKSENKKLRDTNKQQTTFCPVEIATSLKLLYNQVYNFNKQLKRAETDASIVKKKNSKRTVFLKDALILTDIVGGDLAKPSCSSGSTKRRYISS